MILRKTNPALSWWTALFLVIQPVTGLFAMSGSGDGSVQWVTVCTQQGVHQIKVALSDLEQLPAAPGIVGWACPDCVPAPLDGPPFSGVDVLATPLLSGSPEHAVSVSSHLNFLARPALPPRAPPLTVSFNS